MTRYLPIAALLLAVPAAVHAQAATPQSVAAATQLVDTITPPAESKAGMERQIAAMRQGQMIRAMLGGNPVFKAEAAKNQPAFNAGIARIGAMQAAALGPILTDMQTASRRIAIEEYAKRFSAAELNQIIAFYKSPAGAKLLREQPQVAMFINQQVQAAHGQRMETAQKNLAPKIEAELQKLFPSQGQTK